MALPVCTKRVTVKLSSNTDLQDVLLCPVEEKHDPVTKRVREVSQGMEHLQHDRTAHRIVTCSYGLHVNDHKTVRKTNSPYSRLWHISVRTGALDVSHGSKSYVNIRTPSVTATCNYMAHNVSVIQTFLS